MHARHPAGRPCAAGLTGHVSSHRLLGGLSANAAWLAAGRAVLLTLALLGPPAADAVGVTGVWWRPPSLSPEAAPPGRAWPRAFIYWLPLRGGGLPSLLSCAPWHHHGAWTSSNTTSYSPSRRPPVKSSTAPAARMPVSLTLGAMGSRRHLSPPPALSRLLPVPIPTRSR